MKKSKILGLVLSCVLMFALAVSSFAAGGFGETDITQITGALSDFSVTNVLTVLVAALGVAVPLILIWFAFRKIFAWAKSAFYGG